MRVQVLSRILGGAQEDSNPVRIRLIGFRCTGKTTVGRALACRLGVPFWDTDLVLQKRTGRSISLIVKELGWEGFRAMEREVVKELLGLDPAVVALGGGAILDPGTRVALGGAGLTLWLEASVETVLERMAGDPQNSEKRPSLTSKQAKEEVMCLLAERERFYREAAQARVHTDKKSVEQILGEIMALIQEAPKQRAFPSGG